MRPLLNKRGIVPTLLCKRSKVDGRKEQWVNSATATAPNRTSHEQMVEGFEASWTGTFAGTWSPIAKDSGQ